LCLLVVCCESVICRRFPVVVAGFYCLCLLDLITTASLQRMMHNEVSWISSLKSM